MQMLINAKMHIITWDSGMQALDLEKEAYPALDELTSKISTMNLERVRQIKSRLVAISGRVQKVLIVSYVYLLVYDVVIFRFHYYPIILAVQSERTALLKAIRVNLMLIFFPLGKGRNRATIRR